MSIFKKAKQRAESDIAFLYEQDMYPSLFGTEHEYTLDNPERYFLIFLVSNFIDILLSKIDLLADTFASFESSNLAEMLYLQGDKRNGF